MKTFNLTDPGEGLTEAEIVRWLVAEGDEVKINDIVVEVETSKSLVELPIPWAGKVAAILVPVGQTVDVGTPIIKIDDGSAEGDAERTPNLVGYGPTEGATKRRARRGVTAEAEVPVNRALAKPPLRKYAKDRGVDLAAVTPTGTGGVVTRSDVDAYLEAAQAPAAAPVSAPSAGHVAPATHHPGLVERREPIRGVRKATAAAMVHSKRTAPHASEWVTCDVSASMELLERIKARRDFREVKVSPLLLVAKAVCLALRESPGMNTSWDEEAQEIVYHGQVNLGIAVASPRGLLVPNIKEAHELSLLELAVALNEVSARVREGRAQPSELSGGTFTITNVGPFGIDSGTPILNPGEAGILALGQIARRPWVVGKGADERIEPRWVTTLAISFDHRLMDGEGGSLFLADVARILSDPGMSLLF